MNLLQVIYLLNKDKTLIFQRVNDEKFEVFRDDFGRLMMKINGSDIVRSLNIFNYMQDEFKLKVKTNEEMLKGLCNSLWRKEVLKNEK